MTDSTSPATAPRVAGGPAGEDVPPADLPGRNPSLADGDATRSGGDSERIVVRRDRRGTLVWTAIALGVGCLLVFWLPALIVLMRREPGYFTGGMLLTALIATAVVMAIGIGLAMLISARQARRSALTITSEGVQIPARKGVPALDKQWSELELIKIVGRRDDLMAFYPKPVEPVEEPAAEPPASIDLSEPEYLRPLDFDNDPPPAMNAPERAVFAGIRPVPEPEPAAAVSTKAKRERSDRAALYGTPYVVSLVQTAPAAREVIAAVRRYAAGRVPLG